MGLRPCEPEVRTSPVGWTAATPRDHPYRIAVVGATADEARRRFAASFVAWEELHDRAVAARAADTLGT